MPSTPDRLPHSAGFSDRIPDSRLGIRRRVVVTVRGDPVLAGSPRESGYLVVPVGRDRRDAELSVQALSKKCTMLSVIVRATVMRPETIVRIGAWLMTPAIARANRTSAAGTKRSSVTA